VPDTRLQEDNLTAEPRQFEPEPANLRAVRALVCEQAEVDLSHPAVLVASELAANAISHTRRPFTVRVQTSPRIRIEIEDSKPNLRARPTVSSTGVAGHGLVLVDKLSVQWGTVVETDRKIVWAELAW
jgi:hypothetical protein